MRVGAKPRPVIAPAPKVEALATPLPAPMDPVRLAGPRTATPAIVDGVAHVQSVLADIRARKKADPNARCLVVLDLDNTMFETRHRTKRALLDFDRANGTRYFRGLALSEVGLDALRTAEARGLPKHVAEKAQAHWSEFFWKGENFLLDRVIVPVAELALEAKKAGAEVMYLTGRVDFDSTLAQLVAARLPDADAAHVFCKPNVDTKTAGYKVEVMQRWRAEGAHIGLFLTEGRSDIARIQAADATLPCVRLDHPLETNLAYAIREDTPVLPIGWVDRQRRIERR